MEECETYDAAIKTLKSLHTRTKNEVFSRLLLATAKQETGQSIDEFSLSLEKLAKVYTF